MSIDTHDTIFEDEKGAASIDLAEVNFELLEDESKWLLKVVSGPNSGAEYFLSPHGNYLIGTDDAADIIFNDLSVSRQHARLIVDGKDNITIEDIGSKNGTFIEGEKIAERCKLPPNSLVTLGTTTFMIVDREGEHHTIVSPQITPVKKEEPKHEETMAPIQTAVLPTIQSEVEKIKEEKRKEARYTSAITAIIILAIVTGFIGVATLGIHMLFRTETISVEQKEDPDVIIDHALKDFPSIRFSFNPANGKLLLIGHLSTPVEASKLRDRLTQLKFITSVDDTNVVIDEYVVNEFNILLAKNHAWNTVVMSLAESGKFQLTGNLKTKKDSDALKLYVAQNFPYTNLLENRVVVEEEIKTTVAQKFIEQGFKNIAIGFDKGELVLTGTIPANTMTKFNDLLNSIKKIPGIRMISSYVVEASTSQEYVNISDKYIVTGYSAQGGSISVVINGRILFKGDVLDGMTITEIKDYAVLLEKDGFRYKIDFNR